ncbi:hypothetical protein SXCC_02981 [Gluconacetobacter sp. SXCC-1]|nr:hypothetical protein SXCC_02981 [Gluconacetobacter sp. SXCC-1]
MSKVSSFMNDIFCKDDLSGQHHLSLVFDLPNGWENTFNEELKVLENKIIKNNR